MSDRQPSQRDIDRIIVALSQQAPRIAVAQLGKHHAGDDDGIWWFSLPGRSSDIQVESSNGMCPFLVETDEASSSHARTATTVEAAVEMILAYLVA